MPGAATGVLDPRYGYTEQVAAPVTDSGNYGQFGNATTQITKDIYHTLGHPNDGGFTFQPTGALTATTTATQQEPWDYFPFNDRDFTSVAELLLVPGCPPGLFTKQFAEFAPVQSSNVTTLFGLVTPQATPAAPDRRSRPLLHATTAFSPSGTTPIVPHTFPYLVDKFFYSGYGGPVPPATSPRSTRARSWAARTGDGWFKMFEFFEVPSQMIGAIGPVAQGTDFDWLRQDTKPGLINLNLIIDEEVFFSVFGQQDRELHAALLNFSQLPYCSPSRERRWRFAGDVQRADRVGGHVAPVRGAVAGTHGRDRDHGLRIARRRLPDAQCGGGGRRSGRGHRQPDEGGVRPVPVAAARRLGLRLRLRQRPSRPEHDGADRQSQRPDHPGAAWSARSRPTGRSTRCRTRTSITRSCAPRRCRHRPILIRRRRSRRR